MGGFANKRDYGGKRVHAHAGREKVKWYADAGWGYLISNKSLAVFSAPRPVVVVRMSF